MDPISKINVFMTTGLAAIELQVKNEKERQIQLSHHVAQCFHKQCDMYELKEMCRLRNVELNPKARKNRIVGLLVEDLFKGVDLGETSPKGRSNVKKRKGYGSSSVKDIVEPVDSSVKRDSEDPTVQSGDPGKYFFPTTRKIETTLAFHGSLLSALAAASAGETRNEKRRKLGPSRRGPTKDFLNNFVPLDPFEVERDHAARDTPPPSANIIFPITPPKASVNPVLSGAKRPPLPDIPLETPPESPGEVVNGDEADDLDEEETSFLVTPPMRDHEYCLTPTPPRSKFESLKSSPGRPQPPPSPLASSVFHVDAATRPVTAGLRNPSFYCYMNSIIQCLSNIPRLKRWVLQTPLSRDDVPLSVEYQNLTRRLWSCEEPSVDPDDFIEALPAFGFPFPKNKQQDSSEFLVWFLNALHQDLSHKREGERFTLTATTMRSSQVVDGNNNKGELLAKKFWESQLLKNGRSIVTDLFSGQSCSTLECLTCGTMSSTYEQFQCLALPIPESSFPKRAVTVEECLRAYLSREIVGSRTECAAGTGVVGDASPPASPSCKWRCPKCKMPRNFSKKIDLHRLPEVLVVSLNRFHSSDHGARPKKVNDLVNFPLDGLDLSFTRPASKSESTAHICVYDLYCVSNHFGSLSRGHYTAACRTLDGWFAFNDRMVSRIRDPNDVVSPEAYVLFYVRR